MKHYLESLIVEEINRALALKALIPYPLKYPELNGLATRSTSILDDQIQLLETLRSELHERNEEDLRDIFRDLRVCSDSVSLVEYFGIAALYYQTPEIGFLNKLIFKVSQEIKLPFPHPSVCCTGTTHYFSQPDTNVIFTPLTEAEFLLHTPDLYHEIGHCVLVHMKSELRLKSVRDNYQKAYSRVTDYYNQLIRRKRADVGPERISMDIERLHSHWKSWIVEFFCDLFALFTVGPAYAWSHLHLTMKHSADIHELSMIQQTHPSDESRMRILLLGLKQLGFHDDITAIKSKWSEAAGFWGPPETEYQYAYPDTLLEDIVRLIIDGLKQSGLSVFPIDAKKDGEIREMLNEAWAVFWKSTPEDFREWEKGSVKNLRTSLQVEPTQSVAS
jgi:hypothetical protein